MKRMVLIPMLLILLSGAAMAAAPRYPVLKDGETTRGILHAGRDDAWYRTYVFDLPATASAFRIRILEASADVDLFLRHGGVMEDYSEADFYSESEEWLEELHLYRIYETWMPSGRYYLDVVYQLDETPRQDGLVHPEIPFSLVLEIFDGADTTALVPGRAAEGVLSDEEGFLSHYEFEMTGEEGGFRVDVLDTPGDLDLFLSRGNPAATRNEFHIFTESMAGRESLVVEDTGRKLAGTWYLTVYEAVEAAYPVPYRLIPPVGPEPPAAAPPPPELLDSTDPLERGRIATVQLVAAPGIGSGCLVGEKGYIVSNTHVVSDSAGGILDEMIVAVSVDPYEVPVEAFLAEVIDTRPEDDLALLRIVSDRWGRPLAPGTRFPGWRLGDTRSIHPGDPLMILGYPWIGSGLSRPYFTVTRGILSGGERTPRGLLLKTDAVISGGGSGGAVTDGTWRLLGLPAFVVSEDGGQLGYFIPVDRLPRDWRDLF